MEAHGGKLRQQLREHQERVYGGIVPAVVELRLSVPSVQAIWVPSAQAGAFSLQRSGVTMEDSLLAPRSEPFGVRSHS